MRVVLFVLILMFWAAPAPAQKLDVDLELLVMADASGSIDDDEFTLQRRGYAEALQDSRILEAIRTGPKGRIAFSYVEWSGPAVQVAIIPWRVLAKAADLQAVAGTLLSQERTSFDYLAGGTAIGNAILFGVEAIRSNGFTGTRKVIDISGDGPNGIGVPAEFGRDQALAAGITINGLPILGRIHPDLTTFFRQNVIGGPGAFTIPATSFDDIGTAIRLKLIREIAAAD